MKNTKDLKKKYLKKEEKVKTVYYLHIYSVYYTHIQHKIGHERNLHQQYDFF